MRPARSLALLLPLAAARRLRHQRRAAPPACGRAARLQRRSGRPGASPYGLFLAGQAALTRDSGDEAAGFFAQAAAAGRRPGSISERRLHRRAAGRRHSAAPRARRPRARRRLGRRAAPGPADRGGRGAGRGQGQGGRGPADDRPLGLRTAIAAASCWRPGRRRRRATWKTALALPECAATGWSRVLRQLDQALLFERARRYRRGRDRLRAAARPGRRRRPLQPPPTASSSSGAAARPTRVDALRRPRWRATPATALVQAGAGPGRRPARPAPPRRPSRGRRPQALLAPAGRAAGREADRSSALAYLRLVLRLDPSATRPG